MNPPLDELLAELYTTEQLRVLFLHIGHPPGELPSVQTTPALFLADVLPALEYRLPGGRLLLLKRVTTQYPGHVGARALLHRLQAVTEVGDVRAAAGAADLQAATEVSGVRAASGAAGVADDRRHVEDAGATGQERLSIASEPPSAPPPRRAPDDESPATGTRFPTLTLEGADLEVDFLQVIREHCDADATLLYSSSLQCAVLIGDPGERDEELRRFVQDRMRVKAPDCRVTFRLHAFRPYAYGRLIVFGPDTTGYALEAVPATLTPEDIAAEIIAHTRDAATAQPGLVRVVVDHEVADVTRRLDPYATLHECGVREGGRLRVAPDAIAGGIDPAVRRDAVLRAARAVERFAGQDTRFTVAEVDDTVLPGRITVTVRRTGLALPGGGPAGRVSPEPIRQHTVVISFPGMFPLTTPRIVWQTPVFHPNIRSSSRAGLPVGTLQFHPLLAAWRPDFDCVHLARMVSEVAAYRDYDLADGPEAPDPRAAAWAGSDEGQDLIVQIGGRHLADVVRQGDPRTRPPGLLVVKPLHERAS